MFGPDILRFGASIDTRSVGGKITILNNGSKASYTGDGFFDVTNDGEGGAFVIDMCGEGIRVLPGETMDIYGVTIMGNESELLTEV